MTTAWLPKAVLGAMSLEADRAVPLETGGILFGYRSASQNAVVITRMVGPGPGATHGLFEFEPDYEYHMEQTTQIYEKDMANPSHYVGDWHTHLSDYSKLSRKDKRTLKTIATTPDAYSVSPIMLVLKRAEHWAPVVWEVHRKSESWLRRRYIARKCVLKFF